MYGSAKAAIDVISEVWNKELKPFNVSCMAVVVSPIDSLRTMSPLTGICSWVPFKPK